VQGDACLRVPELDPGGTVSFTVVMRFDQTAPVGPVDCEINVTSDDPDPTGTRFTKLRAAGIPDDANSDASPVDGRTRQTVLVADETDLTWDAGIVIEPKTVMTTGGRLRLVPIFAPPKPPPPVTG